MALVPTVLVRDSKTNTSADLYKLNKSFPGTFSFQKQGQKGNQSNIITSTQKLWSEKQAEKHANCGGGTIRREHPNLGQKDAKGSELIGPPTPTTLL